jgi:hypothetical protein
MRVDLDNRQPFKREPFTGAGPRFAEFTETAIRGVATFAKTQRRLAAC